MRKRRSGERECWRGPEPPVLRIPVGVPQLRVLSVKQGRVAGRGVGGPQKQPACSSPHGTASPWQSGWNALRTSVHLGFSKNGLQRLASPSHLLPVPGTSSAV